jgi:hypothetical protein
LIGASILSSIALTFITTTHAAKRAGQNVRAQVAKLQRVKTDLGILALQIPKSWKIQKEDQISHDQNPITTSTLEIEGREFKANLHLMRQARPDSKFASEETIRASLQSDGKALTPKSAEKKMVLERTTGSHRGLRFTLTNAIPKAGEFKVMTKGMMAIDNTLVSYLVLQNEKSHEDAKVMRNAIENLVLETKKKKH